MLSFFFGGTDSEVCFTRYLSYLWDLPSHFPVPGRHRRGFWVYPIFHSYGSGFAVHQLEAFSNTNEPLTQRW